MRASSDYLSGVLLGTLLLCCVAILAWAAWPVIRPVSLETPLAFTQEFTSLDDSWILPGEMRSFEVELKNLTNRDILLDELRFSCPCATGTIGNSLHFPVRLPRYAALPVQIKVASSSGESGPLELKYGVVGRTGDHRVEAGAAAGLRFVQHLNAEPRFISLGLIERADAVQNVAVILWRPREARQPEKLTVESHDPCLEGALELFETSTETTDGRISFGRLLVTVHPSKAPERLSARLTVKSERGELIVPVFGFFGTTETDEEQSK